ncbi:putative membrane protein [Gottschalkia purinilytica]|uniref:Putative membrane protein n=1 Tax=Gottschalkia purinilytica TaxID=1503 RepID=A0A0L0WD23_GOTPU|nr:ECF transporter S component [Gottschalkia purinilytica]KNF09372.1 putative membrane protein [Gottschalkia purinilytica]
MNSKIRRLSYYALMIALVLVATAAIQIPIPFTNGYIHAGDSMIFIAGIMLGWKGGAISGGLGSALADLMLGYPHWSIPTLIIKSVMGGIVGFMSQDYDEKRLNSLKKMISVIISSGWIVLMLVLKSFLTKKVGGFSSTTYTTNLITKLELDGISSLKNLYQSVQTSLSLALILIPIVIIILYIILRLKDKEMFSLSSLIGIILAGVWMVTGYYVAGGILQGSMIASIFTIPPNIIQFVGGMVIAYPILLGLKRTKYFEETLKNSKSSL